MAIREILGADDFPPAARYQTWQLLGKGLIPQSNQGATSANTSVQLVNGRYWFKLTGNANPCALFSLSSAKITVAEMKTKKIYGGFRYQLVNPLSVASAIALLNITFRATGIAVSPFTKNDMLRQGDEVYVKYCIDVPNQSVTVWLDGTLLRTVALGGGANTLTDIDIIYGVASSAHPSEVHVFNDFYWEVDTFDVDGEVAGKLGPVKVKGVKVAGTVLAAGWTVPGGGTADAALDTTGMAPNSELTPVVRSSPDETVSSVGFAKPAAELAIKAVSVEVFAYRDTGTAPTFQAQIKQGAQTQAKQTFTVPTLELNRGTASNRLGCLNKDLNGQAWTPDSIDALEVLVNSKTGS